MLSGLLHGLKIPDVRSLLFEANCLVREQSRFVQADATGWIVRVNGPFYGASKNRIQAAVRDWMQGRGLRNAYHVKAFLVHRLVHSNGTEEAEGAVESTCNA
jgi:hypothetical protein